ncbi:MAG TPA: LD-carboxypeptidase [Sphingobium sp.]
MFSRRATIGGIGGLLTLLAAPVPLFARTPSKPPRLHPGDTVGLIEPAGFSDGQPQIDAVKATIAGMGLVPKVAPHVLSRFGYLAGSDRDRAADINALFADESVRAIFAVRGGWGCARLLPYLDWDVIRANPKLLIGFSDITALHLAFAARAGFATIHGPNAANSWGRISWDSFWRLAFSGEAPDFLPPDAQAMDPPAPERWTIRTIHPGKASGRLIGGNLSVLCALIGTPWMPDLDGAILFLEEVAEQEYRIDRMLSQLALSGQLQRVAGVIFGQCARCGSAVPGYIGFTVPQLLDQYLAPLGIPAFQGANIGHVANQFSLPVGARVEMDAVTGGIRVLEAIVA